ncbi:hypothetical protein, partial [Bacillus phage SPG24]
ITKNMLSRSTVSLDVQQHLVMLQLCSISW